MRQFQDRLARVLTQDEQRSAYDALGDAAQVVADCDSSRREQRCHDSVHGSGPAGDEDHRGSIVR
ncbi:unannotated protein [freshwater metagenome]|uniref:Unannotated protein n=1 Tax=freshwater metagenome TaxID=449393 RepID=A0A6J7GAY7_9ZZZZ